MLTVENINVYGFKSTISTLKLPFRAKSDSSFVFCDEYQKNGLSLRGEVADIGSNDLKALAKAYKEKDAILSHILATFELTVPTYVWQHPEIRMLESHPDTHVDISKSMMSTLTDIPITRASFSTKGIDDIHSEDVDYSAAFNEIVETCEELRKKYLLTKNMKYWTALVQYLPISYNQTRGITLSYRTIYDTVRCLQSSELEEVKGLAHILLCLPYVTEIAGWSNTSFYPDKITSTVVK